MNENRTMHTVPPSASPQPILIEQDVALKPYNTLGVAASAHTLVRIRSEADVRQLLAHPEWGAAPKWVLGGGSNIVLTQDPQAVVLKVEVSGLKCLYENDEAVYIEAGAGVLWHDLVVWTLEQGWGGLENLALIPGTVGAAPVQNIGAYGLELKDRLHSLVLVDLVTGRNVELDAAACRLAYRHSIFKETGLMGLAGKSLITRVRLRLPKPWQPVLGYADLQREQQASGIEQPGARHIFEWVCRIRRAKLPDPALLGNVGSFFKNPVVTVQKCHEIIAQHPHLVHYPLVDGQVKLAAGWLIEACGWKGKALGGAEVYSQQALVLVNRHNASGVEVMALADAVIESVASQFGIVLEVEPTVL
jgi:UDP-N-acetylmuramate dehydrogenase